MSDAILSEDRAELLQDKGIIILPEEIEHSTYEMMLVALMEHPAPVTLYCRGDGGCSRSALAIVDLIRQHGLVTGMLIGEANSSSAVIWAACGDRFVSPHGKIGVHQVAWTASQAMDATSSRLTADEFDRADMENAQVLASASPDHDDLWWYKQISETGSRGLKYFNASELVSMGMAMQLGSRPHPPESEGERIDVEVGDWQSALEAMGYRVTDLNDNEAGAVVRGPNWKVWHTDYGQISHEWIKGDAWIAAKKDAIRRGWVSDKRDSDTTNE